MVVLEKCELLADLKKERC